MGNHANVPFRLDIIRQHLRGARYSAERAEADQRGVARDALVHINRALECVGESMEPEFETKAD